MIDLGILICWFCMGLAALSIYVSAKITRIWNLRKYITDAVLAILLAGAIFATESAILGNYSGFAMYIVAGSILGLLAARMRFGRLPEQFLRRSTRSTSASFLLLFTCAFLFWEYGYGHVNTGLFAVMLILMALLLAALFLIQSLWSLKHYSIRSLLSGKPGEKQRLPSVTLAIPARNETHALTACLEAALQSDYEKLEIIVLDDCSQDSTSELIRSFAHAGVRFVQGDEPAIGWLGKNQAYSTLLSEATGEYILFMGVDTILQPTTVSQLVSSAEGQKLEMISVLPMRIDTPQLYAPRQLRYIWQLVLPLTSDRLPVSSECWLIKRATLQKLGGFKGVKNQVIPEKTFARELASRDTYRFLVANKQLPVYFDKKWSSQWETAIRLWYPTCRQNPLHTLAVALALLLFGIGPFLGLFTDIVFVQTLSFIICIMYLIAYGISLRRLQPRLWWLQLWLLPVALLQDFFAVLASMLRYEFSDVNWKGRNVCYPVLRKL